MEERAVLQTIENNREITWDLDSEFLYEYQRSVLLTLRELGMLDEMQYRYAEAKLTEQYRTVVKKKLIQMKKVVHTSRQSVCFMPLPTH